MMEGLVSFLPASHDGTGALERVTMTSAGGPVGHPAFAVMVVVTEPAGGAEAGLLADAWLEWWTEEVGTGVETEPAEYWAETPAVSARAPMREKDFMLGSWVETESDLMR